MKNRDTPKWRQGCGETEPLLHCWWANKVVLPLWKTVWQFILMKLKVTIQPNNCTSEHKKKENFYFHENLYTNTHKSFICNSQKLEITQMSFSR